MSFGMSCYHHASQPAVSQCEKCNKGICRDCYDSYVDSKTPLCFDCAEESVLEHGGMVAAYREEIAQERKWMLTAIGVFFGIFFVFVLFTMGASGGAGPLIITLILLAATVAFWKYAYDNFIKGQREAHPDKPIFQLLKDMFNELDTAKKVIVIVAAVISVPVILLSALIIGIVGAVVIGFYGTYSFLHRIGGKMFELLSWRAIAFFGALLLGTLMMIPYIVGFIYVIGRYMKQKKLMAELDEILEQDAECLQNLRDYFEYTMVMEKAGDGKDFAALTAEGGDLFDNSYARTVNAKGEQAAQAELRNSAFQIAANGEIIRTSTAA